MKIELVFCWHLNGLKSYDVHCVIDGKDFTIVPAVYSIKDCCWCVKLPDRPIFVSASFRELIDYLCKIIRELFKL